MIRVILFAIALFFIGCGDDNVLNTDNENYVNITVSASQDREAYIYCDYQLVGYVNSYKTIPESVTLCLPIGGYLEADINSGGNWSTKTETVKKGLNWQL